MTNNNRDNKGGIGLVGLVTIVFIILKLCRVITWSWVWVLSPLWISWSLLIILTLILVVLERFSKER